MTDLQGGDSEVRGTSVDEATLPKKHSTRSLELCGGLKVVKEVAEGRRKSEDLRGKQRREDDDREPRENWTSGTTISQLPRRHQEGGSRRDNDGHSSIEN
uniref:Uncharacterized protein n=1 Tax=Steinernema glaseri TaxID=37863 RepID=A0A1I7ZQ55_9BILA